MRRVVIPLTLLTLIHLSSIAQVYLAERAVAFGGLFAAILLLIASQDVANGASRRALSAIKKAMVPAALPLIFIFAQLFPLPGASHPIWESSNAALGAEYSGAVTADRGRTALAIVSYANHAALFFAVMIIAAAKERCEALVLWLAALGSLAALSVEIAQLFIPAAKVLAADAPVWAAQSLMACMALAADVAQRREARSPPLFRDVSFVTCGLFAAIDAAIIALTAAIYLKIAVVIAIFLFAMAMLLRMLTPRMAVFVLCVFLLCIALLGTLFIDQQNLWGLKRDLGSAAVWRMMTEQGPFGMGAGTYDLLKPIYFASADAEEPVSAISIMIIEFGWPASLLFFSLLLALMLALVVGCYRRQRDAHYPAGAIAMLVLTVATAMFGNQHIAASTMVAAVIFAGLGMAQAERSVSMRGT